ncbi:hypothetical protein H6G97_23205 [Nostoc flagelliforme FACHB-838]|uniref:Transposase n=1 Tax=Nostoc flagelliforme FACHB-838 TaxID=2692904 RepID=A0ABR8DSA2_9NOSO|nr:hypothetical protein [Nostoc flagelliforme FACHB-838]
MGKILNMQRFMRWFNIDVWVKLKVPRPQSNKQDEKLVSELKKTRYHHQSARKTSSTRKAHLLSLSG